MTALRPEAEGLVRVLIVEDDDEVCSALVKLLDRRGYSCVVAATAEEAVARLEEDSFELLLTDMDKPGGTGLDLLTKNIDDVNDTGTIVITAADDPDVAEAALAAGAYGYIVKPFKGNEVLISVASALRRRRVEVDGRNHRLRLEQMVRDRTGETWTYIAQLEQAEREMRSLQDETIQRLSVAAEFRDNESLRHIQRMSRYCALIADMLGEDGDRCELIRVASALHDVGKIGIPDNILMKPGSLTNLEWEVMKRHCEIGHRILSGSSTELLKTAASIALTHHERVDGTGYPHGLRGDEIPIEGRIAAIADVFDAVTSDKVYRKAIPMSKAIRILKEGRGTQFDATLLDLFLAEQGRILGIKERYADLRMEDVEMNPLTALVAES